MAEQSILSQVKAEAAKAKRDSAKAKIKALYADYNKATEVVAGIEKQIVDIIKEIGDSPEDVRTLLSE